MEKNKEVDRYIAETPEEFRELLSNLRDQIFEYFPEATETFAYRIPVYRYKGKPIFSIAAFKDHYSIITQDKDITDKIPELKDYKTSGTTIHFTAQKPLTANLLEKIIKHRVSDRDCDI